MKRALAGLVLLCFALLACTPRQTTAAISTAESALIDFIQALSDGNYERAAQLYGGSYEQLRAMNPQNDPDDLAGLWQAGCEVNGLVCLPVGRVIERTKVSEEEMQFIVEFRENDGQVFSLGPCCGAEENAAAPRSAFEFHVLNQNGFPLIMDMPALIP
ncbi:outer membrane protein assembly factor BamD [Pelolinea submarina]|uniref:LysM domain-containing protein n=1 Tax=Pelolinea submarina TaxID=913107 RepID=A0A347ZP75_9CHLR|nr:hypothetical protein [Pelolinea submarina]REG08707.1 hypothetical protein DFR64_2082 [Pelolinea submarina]BBB47106.1 hypothetical protein Pelsub_P0333 [Pelolinea submarina]